MKWLILLLLAGCAADKPVSVDIPVYSPCVTTLPPRPVAKFGQGEYPGDKAAAQAALIDAAAWEWYATLLEVQLAGCVPK